METDKTCSAHPNAGVKFQLTPEIKHYGKFCCNECDKFVVWAKSPKTCDELQERQQRIVKMIKTYPELTEEQVAELCKLYGTVHLTLINQGIWEKYISKYN